MFDKVIGNKKVRAIDIGCGNGNWVIDELRPKFSYVLGFDIDADATSKNTTADEIIIGDLSSVPTKQPFDAVISLWVFEHVQDTEYIFSEMSTHLKKGSHVAFITPNDKCFLVLIRKLFNVFSRQGGDKLVSYFYGRGASDIFPTYYRMNNANKITKLAQQAGFQIEALTENFDPSYTSFNKPTYLLSRFFYKSNLSLFKPHLLGILTKK